MKADKEEDRCQAITVEVRWKRQRQQDLRCSFFARVQVDQKRLCHRHAMCEALAALLKTGQAKVIPVRQARDPYQPVPIVTEE